MSTEASNLTTGHTFTETEQVTHTKLNNLVNNAVIATGGIKDTMLEGGEFELSRAGGVKIGKTQGATVNAKVEILSNEANGDNDGLWVSIMETDMTGVYVYAVAASGTNSVPVAKLQAVHTTDATDFDYIQAVSDDRSDGYDNKFKVGCTGNVSYDGASSSPAADYAEMFEWADGNPSNQDRVGCSVVLSGDKIALAQDSDTPIGVISGRPSVIGDNPMKWHSKWLTDEFNRRTGQLNPDYNADQAGEADKNYVMRSDRKEWGTVGLLGKIRLKKGQPTAPGWIKLKDISDTVEEWLVK